MSNVIPEEIQVPGAGPGGGVPGGAGVAPEGGGGDTPDERAAIDALQALVNNEPDDAKSAMLAKLLAELYKLVSAEQDTQMKMLGGDPAVMRQMARRGGGGGGGGGGLY